jgi:hypothetical protein
VSHIATCVFLASSVSLSVCARACPDKVALWFVIGPCVICLWTCVCFELFRFYLLSIIFNFFVLETPDDG